jgi:hypothetical protein
LERPIGKGKMRLAIIIAVTAAAASRAQAPGYLLNDLEAAAKRDIPYFAVEARLRIAELTRLSDVAVSRRFAESAAGTGVNLCGNACYYAMRTLAGLDIEAALEAADTNEWQQSYRALIEQAVYNDDPTLLFQVLNQAHRQRHFVLPPIYEALAKWGEDDQFVRDLTRNLVNGFPAEPTPDDAIFLFGLFSAVGPPRIDADVIRRAVEQTLSAVTRPSFNVADPFPFQATFEVHVQIILTYSRAEAAFLTALAFGVAIDEKAYFNDTTRLARWASTLKGLTIENLAAEVKSLSGGEMRPTPPGRGVPELVPDLRTTPFDEAMLAIAQVRTPALRGPLLGELARRGGLTEVQYTRLYNSYRDLLPNLDEYNRLDAVAALYSASLAWPHIPEQERAVALYVSELQRLAVLNHRYGAGMRDSGDLVDRLDLIVKHLGRVPSKWPECVRDNPSLLLRHLVYEAEQATLYSQIDATFRITGGSDITLRSLRGRVVVIVSWRAVGTTCESLRQAINKLNYPIGNQGLWAIALSEEPERAVLRTLDQKPFWASIAIDQASRTARSLGIREIPSAVVIDRAGKVVARIRPQLGRAGLELPLDDLYRAIEDAGVQIPEKSRIR